MEDDMRMGNNRIHYAWIVMVGCFLLIVLALSMATGLLGVFLTPLMDELGLNKAEVSSILGMISVMQLSSSVVTNYCFQRFPVRQTIGVIGLFMPIGMFMLSHAQSLIQCYAAALTIGFSEGCVGLISVSYLLTIWFEKRRGLALGIATAGSGFSNMVMPPILYRMITSLGVRGALSAYAVLMLILVIIAFVLICDDPAKKNLQPYGHESSLDTAPEKREEPTITWRMIVTIPQYWVVSGVVFIVGGSMYGIIAHLVAFACETGSSMETGTYAFSVFGLCMLIGKLAWGRVLDLAGDKAGTVMMFILWIGSLMISQILGGGTAILMLFAALLGLGSPIGTICLPLWVTRIFTERNYVPAYTAIVFIQTLGVAASVVFFGLLDDLTGSYKPVYMATIILTILAFAGIMWCYRKGDIRK